MEGNRHANSLLSIVEGLETAKKRPEQHRMGLMGLFLDPISIMDARLLVMLPKHNRVQPDLTKASDDRN